MTSFVPLHRGLLPDLRQLRGPDREDDAASDVARADERPMREELFSVAQLERHARTMAAWHELAERRRHDGADRLLARLAANERVLEEAHALASRVDPRGPQPTPAVEWFVDNYHVVEEQIRTARRHLPRAFNRQLPQLANGTAHRTPRVYDIALALISHSHGHFDVDRLRAFVSAYQETTSLRIGELWALPIMLRLALIENLRRVMVTVNAGRLDRERAARWAAALIERGATDPSTVVLVLADMVAERPPLSDPFVAEFATRLQGQGTTLALPMSWLEQRLAHLTQTVDQVFRRASRSQAADQVAVSNTIGSLRALGATNWREFVESTSAVERALRDDPTADYPRMDFGTRDRYRHGVEQIARASRLSERAVAAAAIDLARTAARDGAGRRAHVGYYLIGDGRDSLELETHAITRTGAELRRLGRALRLPAYGFSIVLVTTLTVGLLARLAGFHGHGVHVVTWWALFAISASHLAVSVTNWAVTLLVAPKSLPRLDFDNGIPDSCRSVVAVPVMLGSPDEIDDAVEALEVRYLANRDPNLYFALLTDFRDAASEVVDGDADLVSYVRERIEGLNAKYTVPGDADARFCLFHRARRWNANEGVWMGWERKRGKFENFNDALRGDAGAFDTIIAPMKRLEDATYVIAVDADTMLPRGAARMLAGTMAHPLNRPVFDDASRRVVDGYGILQPRVGVSAECVARTTYCALFAGDAGIDPYTHAVSDVYQDVFAEGSFVGKGIYDIDAVRRALGGRLPDNQVLSHDLLEGAYARSGLVSDVLLVEDHPTSYVAERRRRSRWIRGDWQIIAWLAPFVPERATGWRRNRISMLSRWKIFDNLRRSVAPIALLSVLLVGWMRHGMGLFATCALGLLYVLPGLLVAMAALARRPADHAYGRHAWDVTTGLVRQLERELFVIACLPDEAYVSLRAILLTLTRVCVTRRRMLQWMTAHDAERSARVDLVGSYVSMWIAPAFAVCCAMAMVYLDRQALLAAAPLLGLWIAAPAIASRTSRPVTVSVSPLPEDDTAFLRTVARRTWRYFETFIGPDDNHLPPDNFQEEPTNRVAHRTSPTNIGISMLATLSAHDFGYLTVSGLIDRTNRTLLTLDRMERHRGHFYNWYDTRTLEPLRPMYVSTVDSGNLAAHLIILASGLEEVPSLSIAHPEIARGLGATLDVLLHHCHAWPDVARQIERLRRECATRPSTLRALRAWIEQLIDAAQPLADHVVARQHDAATWWASTFASECRAISSDLLHCAPWLELPSEEGAVHTVLDAPASLADIAQLAATLVPSLAQGPLRDAVALGAARATQRIADLRHLASRCRGLADVDYEFLYDRGRHLLSIGYNVSEHRLDAGYYDLLASEARLTSFIAIAQDKVPQEHWFHLGRAVTTIGGSPALLSWSGTMFEYLMPLLVMPTYERTLLDATYHAVVNRQIAYGARHRIPWGVSEAGYNKTDLQSNYQYRAFGVPGLGYQRGLAEDIVVAPYASALALMVAPGAACANLRRLEREGRLGAYGFYESIDYTPARVPPGASSVTVRSYMAHHQGMVLMALAYELLDRPMQRRFDADPECRATTLLLQERVPRVGSVFPHAADSRRSTTPESEADVSARVYDTPTTPTPEVHLLSNGRYHVAITNAGGGYSRWRDLAVTRWREDATLDCWGSFAYLRDLSTGAIWSVGHQPTLVRASSFEAIYSQGRAEFRRVDGDVGAHVLISVSPEDDVEVRRVTITNRARSPRTIEITSYAEVVLAPPAADAAHPAFSNLFVESEILRPHDAIVCTRRPRSATEKPPWMIHLVTTDATTRTEASFETSRAAFIGRGRSTVDPIAMHRPSLGNSAGAVLDPIVAVRISVLLQPEATARFDLVTGMAETRDAASGLLEKYRDHAASDRVFDLSWTHAQLLRRQVEASNADAQLYERLASSVLYTNPTTRAPRDVLARSRGRQSGLWAHGISGDLPIVLVRIAAVEHIDLVRHLARAHAYWRLNGLAADLVIWNEDPSGYRQTLHDEIAAVVASVSESSVLDKPGGVFIRSGEQLSEEDKTLIQAVARVVLRDTAGALAEQIERRPAPLLPPPLSHTRERGANQPLQNAPTVAAHIERADLTAFNGIGGFTPDGKEYVITTSRDARTPAPWVNVLANPWFGSIVSESGGAYTWCENAQTHRLTPWCNDAVTDASGEAVYVRDEQSAHVWSPTPLPAAGAGPYTTRHGFGYTVFEVTERGIYSELKTYVAIDAPVKFVVLKLRNRSGKVRRLSVSGFFELVLGAQRADNAPHVVTEIDAETSALVAHNPYSTDFSERVAFLQCSEEARTVSGDRDEFLGRNGAMQRPAAMRRRGLSGRVGAGLDPCFAMQTTIELAEGQEREIAFVLGSGRDLVDARHLATRFRGIEPAHVALGRVWGHWNRILGAVNVQTPDTSLNVLSNGWLMYQVIACRMWGRSGFYQSGGAFGFRDQLQDAMALIHADPGMLREHILRASARQFPEGDVQHWWHPPAGRGVRTRIADDFLWLPAALCRYVTAIGDTGILDEPVGFIEGRPLADEEESYYDLPARSAQVANVYEHCRLAVRHGIRLGPHGLPLMGSGDWNDGMNLVGEHGQGESVWLGFFLYDVLRRFGELARRHGDVEFADTCVATAAMLRKSLDEHAWDGGWYLRAFFDDGRPLGSSTNAECQIDSLPQSWAVLSQAAEADRTSVALDAVDRRLVRRDIRVIQLLDPPFDVSDLNPGYVKGYAPGVRENGAQYTHAAVWVAMAFAAAGRHERAWELFGLINPVRHGDNPDAIARYKVEPYVVAADVYTNPRHAGRGGWTWYTGSAGWMYRLITESLLGLSLEVDRLRIAPAMPAAWESFDVHYRYRETLYHIHVRNRRDGGTRVKRMVCDGVEQGDMSVALRDDHADHHVEVEIGE